MAWINWLTCKDRIWQKWRNVISKIKVIKRLGLLYWGLAFSHPLSEFLTLEKASCHVMRWLYAEVHVIGSETLTVSDTKKESEVTQSCPTLHDPMDCSLPGSSIHGIFQARVLEWVAISFSRWFSNPGIEPRSPTLQVDALPFEPPENQTQVSDNNLTEVSLELGVPHIYTAETSEETTVLANSYLIRDLKPDSTS